MTELTPDDEQFEQQAADGDTSEGGTGDPVAAPDAAFNEPASTAGEPDHDVEASLVTAGDAAAPDPAPAAYGMAAAPPSSDFWQRVGRRIVRRPSNWINSPWPTERVIQYLTALVLLGGATFAVLQVVHLDLVFQNNTPTGGDMGAHVMAPAYLRDHLLSNGQLSGWSNYWYAGFPLYRFYMVIPALMIVFLNIFFDYGVAFKIVVCLGIVTLPFCCWAFGRLARFRYPIPELFALAALLFLFDESFTIYGGNVPSTMAGEFSFSIALSFSILGLGLLARGLETGKYRNWTAIVLALAILSHGLVAIFVVFAAMLMWIIWLDKTRFIYGLTMGITSVMLTAFWLFPFILSQDYMTDMKYGFRPNGGGDSFWDMFFDLSPFWNIVVSSFALIGFVSSVAKRNLNGAWLGITSLALMSAIYFIGHSGGINLLWNPRLLPFFYLLRFMLMMVGIADVVHFVVKGIKMRAPTAREIAVTGAVLAGVVGVVVGSVELFFFHEMPGAEYTTKAGKSVYSWGPITVANTGKKLDAYSDGWTRYNFTGYEGKPAYGEYSALVNTMASLGENSDPNLGCGRAMWEVNSANGAYGTTMALMLLPHWTDGCIASEEGLFFEASGTTPYHFLTAAAMSANSSNPVRELRYTDNSASVGVPMLQKMGVKYVMVFTEAAKQQAELRSELTKVASSGPWDIYRVADSEVVVPLTVQPVVVNERGGDQRERNLELGTSWFQHSEEWAAMPADDGPPEWQRIDVDVDLTRRVGKAPLASGRKVDIVVPAETITTVPLKEITISNYHMGDQDLSFDVSEIGVPVLVKVSYFPNWEVDGAKGPYRIAPNFMVVVPTSKHVRLHYEASGSDKVCYLITIMGIALMIFWRKRGDIVHRNTHPFLTTPSGDWSTADPWAVTAPEVHDHGPPDGPSPFARHRDDLGGDLADDPDGERYGGLLTQPLPPVSATPDAELVLGEGGEAPSGSV